ncbi:PPC domain-containing DNA-binding protein [Selenihalanaerobacter shriftii]|uniref:PPC domain-containing protein n=1 Tax=Selenihalanaerobacter shriftii TaxID=142842 RepID=A0A1T4K6I4_9FIRM|nr:PPC domain-containing DNA-binding protein [Selenihalanaerobacter shriftii]SJZ38050.1 hypothetical protein SAMN02745118_00644 [Selenihalanaerobacter shriftii]
MLKEYEVKNVYMGRLPYGADLIEELTEIVKEKKIKAGKVTVIGAVKQGVISFYDQEEQEYYDEIFDEKLEIANCTGNISLKDAKPMIHAHISFGNEKGEMFGGHLSSGTIIFAGEYIIEEFAGEPFKRGLDKVTGLTLWE